LGDSGSPGKADHAQQVEKRTGSLAKNSRKTLVYAGGKPGCGKTHPEKTRHASKSLTRVPGRDNVNNFFSTEAAKYVIVYV